MRKYLIQLIISVCCGIVIPLHAQYSSITGKITDEKAQPLPYVTLQLTTPDTVFIQGTTTDEQGSYKLTEVGPGDYLLFLSSVGYGQKAYPFRQENKDRALPDIILKSSSVALQEVEVKAQSIVQLDDRMLVFPEKQQVRHSYTGYDLLDRLMIPGLDVDRRGGSVKNFAGTVTLYIDGRKADFREVQSLRPRDVEKVEYFEAPTGKYAMDVASINYITKKYTSGGYVSLDARQTIGYLQGDYNASMKINKGNTAFTVWGGHNMTRYEGSRTVSDETYTFPDQSITKHSETADGLQRSNRQYAQASVENRTDRHTLQAKAGFTRNATPEDWREMNTTYSNHPDEDLNTHNEQEQIAIMPNLDLYGDLKIKDNQRIEMHLNNSFSNTQYKRSYDEGDFYSYTQVNENFYRFFGSLNYTLQMKQNQSLAIHFFQNYAFNSTHYVGDYNQQAQYWLDQSFLFGEYAVRLRKKFSLNVNVGLLWELYRLKGGKIDHHPSPMYNMRFTFQPTTKQTFMLYSGMQQILPSFQWMNPVEQKVDSFMVKRGNPNQDWYTYWNNQLSYNVQLGKVNLNAATGFILATIPFSFYFVEGDNIVNTYNNGNTTTRTILYLGITWKPMSNLHFKANGNYCYQQGKGSLPYKHNIWLGSLQANYYWKSLGINVFFNSSQHVVDLDAMHTLSPFKYGLSVNWSYRGLWIEVGTNSPFSRDLARRSYLDAFPTVYSYDKTIHDRTYQQTGWVKVAYNFDFGRKTAKDKDRVNTDIQSTILKAE